MIYARWNYTLICHNNPESINSNVMVIINQYHLTSATCKYLQPQTSSIKSCLVGYGPSGTCADPPYVTQQRKFTNSTIDVDLSPFPKFHNETQYCYRVIANNGTSTVVVIGTFFVGKCLWQRWYVYIYSAQS